MRDSDRRWSIKLWSSIATILQLGRPLPSLDQSSALLASATADSDAFARLHPGPFLFAEVERSEDSGPVEPTERASPGGRAQVTSLVRELRGAERADPGRSPACHFLIELRADRSLGRATVTLGRHPSCDIAIDDLRISTLHAYFGELDGCWYVADADSENGTFIGGAPLEDGIPRPLMPKISMRFGQRVFARFLESEDLRGIAKIVRRLKRR